MQAIKGINVGLAFVLELVMLYGFGYLGYYLSPNNWIGWALAIFLPTIVLLLWAIFFAPRSNKRLALIPGALLSLGLFLLAAIALVFSQQPLLGIIFGVVSVVNRALALLWQQW